MTPSEAHCIEHPTRAATPCARCGTFRCEACLSAGLCSSCRSLTRARTPVPGDGVDFGRRAGARIIDLVVGQGVALAAGLTAGIVLGVAQSLDLVRDGWMERLDQGFAFNFIGGLASALVGATIGVSVCGASLGKAVLGLRVVDLHGERAGVRANFIRELAYNVDALFFGLVGKSAMDGSPLQQRYGDRWADTVVVRTTSVSAEIAGSPLRLLLGIGLGLAAHGAVLAAFFIGSAW